MPIRKRGVSDKRGMKTAACLIVRNPAGKVTEGGSLDAYQTSDVEIEISIKEGDGSTMVGRGDIRQMVRA